MIFINYENTNTKIDFKESDKCSCFSHGCSTSRVKHVYESNIPNRYGKDEFKYEPAGEDERSQTNGMEEDGEWKERRKFKRRQKLERGVRGRRGKGKGLKEGGDEEENRWG